MRLFVCSLFFAFVSFLRLFGPGKRDKHWTRNICSCWIQHQSFPIWTRGLLYWRNFILYPRIRAVPNVAKWLATRPNNEFWLQEVKEILLVWDRKGSLVGKTHTISPGWFKRKYINEKIALIHENLIILNSFHNALTYQTQHCLEHCRRRGIDLKFLYVHQSKGDWTVNICLGGLDFQAIIWKWVFLESVSSKCEHSVWV